MLQHGHAYIHGSLSQCPKVVRCTQVYVWARRHQYVTLSFLGIFTFTAPYLPWVLLAFSVVLRSSPVVDLMGMLAGAPFLPCHYKQNAACMVLLHSLLCALSVCHTAAADWPIIGSVTSNGVPTTLTPSASGEEVAAI